MRRLLITDVDGVLTTGRKHYDLNGMPVHKEFFDKDFTALKYFTAAGFTVAFVSSDNFVNEKIAANRNYRFLYTRGEDKGTIVMGAFDIKRMETIIAFGDDVFDLPILALATHRVCPSNAAAKVKQFCSRRTDFISRRAGGDGVIQDAAEFFESEYLANVTIEMIEKLDRKERF